VPGPNPITRPSKGRCRAEPHRSGLRSMPRQRRSRPSPRRGRSPSSVLPSRWSRSQRSPVVGGLCSRRAGPNRPPSLRARQANLLRLQPRRKRRCRRRRRHRRPRRRQRPRPRLPPPRANVRLQPIRRRPPPLLKSRKRRRASRDLRHRKSPCRTPRLRRTRRPRRTLPPHPPHRRRRSRGAAVARRLAVQCRRCRLGAPLLRARRGRGQRRRGIAARRNLRPDLPRASQAARDQGRSEDGGLLVPARQRTRRCRG
jgi:hypothetical protein